MTGRTLVLAAVIALAAAGPAAAGKLLDAAPKEMRNYADQAGYILASIPVCGGDRAEEDYFRRLARDNLVQIGADDDDLGFLDHYMAEAAASAKPKKRECREEGAVPLAGELFGHRTAIEKALKAQ
ncbi:hypothetical protein GCM10017083_47950 [Thalassobaculum fulvum]|uniref:Uncharacterized protein n=1 Tax=Thalassobaculum fulvum TaxID=1633335 RepID=A0A918XW98_9PROT|nr:hypothetical protein [Thalassobaculum fulvum]GHD61062.1 hypothetical protein GCM10017083_47950 [Thalassobaculum fulvum]